MKKMFYTKCTSALIVFMVMAMDLFSQSPPITTVGAATFTAGTYTVPIMVSGFANVGNISMKLNYDATKLVYTGVTVNAGLVPASTLVTPTTDQSGVFSLSYSSGSTVVLAAPVNTLFSLTFTAKTGAATGQTPLTWSTLQGDCDITPLAPGVYVPPISVSNLSDLFY